MNVDSLPTSDYGSLRFKPLVSEIASVTELGNILVIEHQGFYAEVSLYGGQVLKFQQTEQHPIFWLTEQLHCGTSPSGKHTAIRGGVPICWPWFGPHPDATSAKHGFSRDLMWQLDNVMIHEKSVSVTLMLSGENNHELWPQPFKLTQDITFSVHSINAFEQTLTMHNLSAETVKYTGALHSYFQVSSPKNVVVPPLEQAPFYNQLSTKNCQPTPLLDCRGPIDRIYHSGNVMQLVDKAWQRTLEITPSNTQQWVLWNPGSIDAANMADVHENGEQGFVCLEAANTQWQHINPYSNVSINQVISVK